MKILFLSRWYPHPPDNGSKLRVYNLLRGLAQHHDVTLLSFSDQPGVDPDMCELRSFCREVRVVPWKPFNPYSLRAQLGFLSSVPRAWVDTFSWEMAQAIRQTLTTQNYNLVIASQVSTAAYSRYLSGLPALFEEVEIGVPYERFTRSTSPWHRLRFGLSWLKHRRYLARLLQDFRVCTVVSEQERQLLAQAVPAYKSIDVIPNSVNLADYEDVQAVSQSNTLIFTGSFRYAANYDAMVWFLQEIYPRIQARIPDIHLVITGDHANLPLPTVDNVTLTGFVEDVRPLIASSGLGLAPLRVGGGTRLKILEAMALRTPVVATSKGAEGLDVRHGEQLLIADTAEAFAEAVICLSENVELRRQLADKAYQVVREKYDWAVVIPRFLDLVERTVYT